MPAERLQAAWRAHLGLVPAAELDTVDSGLGFILFMF
jgi:hypothetical protein